MVGVGEQQYRRLQRPDFDDLADHAARIDHRLPGVDAVIAARAQDQALAGGIEVDVQHRRELHVEAALLRRAEQAAQARVVGVDRGQPRHARVGHQQLVAQATVLGSELAERAGVVGNGFDHASGQAGHGPHRLGQHLGLLPHTAEPAAAVIEHDQDDGHGEVRQQPQGVGDVAGAACGGTGVGRHVRSTGGRSRGRRRGRARRGHCIIF